jgi:hypothetical protein
MQLARRIVTSVARSESGRKWREGGAEAAEGCVEWRGSWFMVTLVSPLTLKIIY